MDLILAGLTWNSCLVYVDDIIIFSKTVSSHIQRLEEVFQRLAENNLKNKPEKCQFLQEHVTLLGYKVSGQGISLDPEKTRIILELKPPTCIKELRSYIGCFSYYRRFISQFSIIAEPLYALTRKGEKFKWTSKQDYAFQLLKSRLTEALFRVMMQLQSSMSTHVTQGAVVSQIIDGKEKQLAFASRTLNPAERNYCITRREALALIYGLKVFRQHCLGRDIIIRTDHAPLITIQSTPTPSAQICRWLDFLQEYSFTIQHRPGLRHGNADGCSCASQPCSQCHLNATSYEDNDKNADSTPLVMIRTTRRKYKPTMETNFDMADAQLKDPVIEAVNNSTTMPVWETLLHYSKDTKNLFAQWSSLLIQDGVLYRKFVDGKKNILHLQCIIPFKVRNYVLHQVHAGITSGHYGIKKTLILLSQRAYWKNWRSECIRFVKRCNDCSAYHRGLPQRQGELQDMTVGSPMERAGIDLTGPWPTSGGNKYTLTFIDHFTKWADAVAIPNKESITVAKALIEKIFTQVGCVLQIISDQGKEFDNHLLTSIRQVMNIEKTRTTPYKPSTNASVERLHRTMNQILGKMVNENQKNWTEILPFVIECFSFCRIVVLLRSVFFFLILTLHFVMRGGKI